MQHKHPVAASSAHDRDPPIGDRKNRQSGEWPGQEHRQQLPLVHLHTVPLDGIPSGIQRVPAEHENIIGIQCSAGRGIMPHVVHGCNGLPLLAGDRDPFAAVESGLPAHHVHEFLNVHAGRTFPGSEHGGVPRECVVLLRREHPHVLDLAAGVLGPAPDEQNGGVGQVDQSGVPVEAPQRVLRFHLVEVAQGDVVPLAPVDVVPPHVLPVPLEVVQVPVVELLQIGHVVLVQELVQQLVVLQAQCGLQEGQDRSHTHSDVDYRRVPHVHALQHPLAVEHRGAWHQVFLAAGGEGEGVLVDVQHLLDVVGVEWEVVRGVVVVELEQLSDVNGLEVPQGRGGLLLEGQEGELVVVGGDEAALGVEFEHLSVAELRVAGACSGLVGDYRVRSHAQVLVEQEAEAVGLAEAARGGVVAEAQVVHREDRTDLVLGRRDRPQQLLAVVVAGDDRVQVVLGLVDAAVADLHGRTVEHTAVRGHHARGGVAVGTGGLLGAQ